MVLPTERAWAYLPFLAMLSLLVTAGAWLPFLSCCLSSNDNSYHQAETWWSWGRIFDFKARNPSSYPIWGKKNYCFKNVILLVDHLWDSLSLVCMRQCLRYHHKLCYAINGIRLLAELRKHPCVGDCQIATTVVIRVNRATVPLL